MNNVKINIRCCIIIVIFLMMTPCLFAQSSIAQTQPPPPSDHINAPPPPPPVPPPLPTETPFQVNPMKKIAPGVFRLGDIEIDKKSKSVNFPVFINMNSGLLEYLLVRTGGKTHESLFRTRVQPYDLQVAFLLIGFEGSDKPLGFQGALDKPRGEHVMMTVTYKKADGKTLTVQPEDWIVMMVENKPRHVKKMDWVFTGSMINNGDFMAQREGSIIAIYHDPVAMIDNASQGGESDEVWFVNKETCPPEGTPVTLTIKSKK